MHSTNLKTAVLVLFCFNVLNILLAFSAQAKVPNNQHSQHSLMGSHGMVLMHDANEGFFVSHLPLYSSPHNYQLIYKVKIEKSDQLLNMLQKEMVTLVPDNFDLSRLIRGESFAINTMFFQGHFERGGKQKLTAKLTFEKSILAEKVSTSYSTKDAVFYTVVISDQSAIFAHKIQRSPSFDAIGFIKRSAIKNKLITSTEKKSNSTKATTNTASVICDKPTTLEPHTIKQQLESCAQFEIKYIETKDFS